MNEYEAVSELVKRTGAAYETAKYAYETCGGDLNNAAVMLEKARNNYAAAVSGPPVPANDLGAAVRENAKKAAKEADGIFKKLCRNELKIINGRELFSMPLIAAVVLALILWQLMLAAVTVSLFLGTQYIFTGPDFNKDFVLGFPKSRGSTAVYPVENHVSRPENDFRRNFSDRSGETGTAGTAGMSGMAGTAENGQDKGFF